MTNSIPSPTLHNGAMLPLAQLPLLSVDDFLQTIIDATDYGWRLASYFADGCGPEAILYALLAFRSEGKLAIITCRPTNGHIPSITSLVPQANLFERELAEQFRIIPDQHPWFKPLRFHAPFCGGRSPWQIADDEPIRPGVMEFYRIDGDEIHEVAVGPVHAGVIEPGHFRFQCHGEHVYHLEISLGYQHRAVEQGIVGGPHPITLYQMETVAGDSTIAHGQAYSMLLESLSGCHVPLRAETIRAIALELERLANHTGDIGAIAGDIGYLPTASFCGRIRGDFLNMSALICGSRFGRGIVRPGGCGFDLSQLQVDQLQARLASARRDLTGAVNLLWSTPSVMNRLEGTGVVTGELAEKLALVGPAARASGLSRDVRKDYPFGTYRLQQIPIETAQGGDVYSRTQVRWLEASRSLDYLDELLGQLPSGDLRSSMPPLAPSSIALALTEGWRGEICHVGITDSTGRFKRYKIVDPSFHNWSGLAMSMRNGQISDFPLCNKSFNLSYCGFDL